MIRTPRNRSPDGVLDRDDPVVGGDRAVGLVGDRDAGAARDVVEHHRQAARRGDRLEVRGHAGRRGLVVVGRHEQHAVGADLLGLRGELDGVRGVVGADARDDLHPVAHRLDDGPQDLRRPPRCWWSATPPSCPTRRRRRGRGRRGARRPGRCPRGRPSRPSWKAVTIAVSTRPNGAGGRKPDVMASRLSVQAGVGGDTLPPDEVEARRAARGRSRATASGPSRGSGCRPRARRAPR